MRFVSILLLALLCSLAQASERSSAQTRAFQRLNPCPSTGERRGKCPGYVIDHVCPLCAGCSDTPDNMQWQTVADAKVKDREEWKLCRRLRLKGAEAGDPS